MHPSKKHFSARGLVRGVVALPVIFSLLTALVLAASPGLHARWHHDAGSPSHQCAVSLLTQHHLTPAPAPFVFLPEVLPPTGLLRLEPVELCSSSAFLLPPERGPPPSSVPAIG